MDLNPTPDTNVTNFARPACERPHPLMATVSLTSTDNSVVVLPVHAGIKLRTGISPCPFSSAERSHGVG